MKTTNGKNNRDTVIAACGGTIVLALCFVFFQCFYQQHLLHREQNNLFISSWQYIDDTYHGMGWLAHMAGDYLTQFFYYLGAGAAILSVSLAAIWVLAYLLARQCSGLSRSTLAQWLAVVIATMLTAWQCMRETGSSFQYAATVSVTAMLAIANIVVFAWRKSKVAGAAATAVLVPAYAWCFAWWHDQWYNVPDFGMERVMAIDNAAYFGNWDTVEQLSAEMPESRLAVYYNCLANARQGRLADAVKDKIALGPEILLPVVGPKSSYMRIGATGRAWHMMGDYTMAEHCYILSMIFSPRSTGSRHLRQMAQVNIDNGDYEAAVKYLHMLSETTVHSRWANRKLEQLTQTESSHATSPCTTSEDTVRAPNDMLLSLRHACHADAGNAMAYDYLMSYHLVTGNMMGIMQDYDAVRPNHPWYQQALLIALTQADTDASNADAYGISPSVRSEFSQYVEMYLRSNGDMQAMNQKFGHTYWYHYHLINQRQ